VKNLSIAIVLLFLFSGCAIFAQGINMPQRSDNSLLRNRLMGSRRGFGGNFGSYGGNNNSNSSGQPMSGNVQSQSNVGQNAALAGAEAYASAAQSDEAECDLNFVGADLGMVFKVYSTLIGKTILRDPGVADKQINLKSEKGQKLTKEEQIEAIEMVLEMNEVHLEPYGEKFIRAVPRGNASKEAPKLVNDETLGVSGKVVSMIIRLNFISYEEALKILQEVATTKAKLQGIERNNSILVTDTELNIQRMLMLVKQIDIESKPTEEVKIYQIKNASASDIQQVLQRIVEESQKELSKNANNNNNRNNFNQNQPWMMRRNNLLRGGMGGSVGRNGANPATQPQVATTSSILSSISDADRGLIRGKVVILSDERSNKLVIITSASNHKFFKTLIEELDVETTPETEVKVYRLKYAEAEEVSDMINDLIGNAPSSKNSSKQNQNQNAKSGRTTNVTGGRTATSQAASSSSEAKTGELSKENTTVLADKRINGLVVMTRKELVPVVEKIIHSMDIKLSQVLIETVIIEVSLGDNLNTGIDWVMGGDVAKNVFMNHGQMIGGGAGQELMKNFATSGLENSLTNMITPIGKGVQYLMKSDKLNLAAVITASKTDDRTKYLASPIIMTVDNKEATIEATSSRQLLTGWSAVSGYNGAGMPSPNYTAKDLGITLKVKPKINPNGTVMLNVEEEYSQIGGKQDMLMPNDRSYEPTKVDVSVTRKMTSDILLDNAQTVILGGLVENSKSESESGIPILKDIPWIGKWLFGEVSQSESRKELLIFMTPYVLDDADAAKAEAIRRKKTMSDPKPWDDNGWSASDLSDGVSKKEQLRRIMDEWAKQDEERKTRMAIEQEKVKRAKALEKMSEEERKTWLELHKKDLEKDHQKELEAQMLDPQSQSQLKELAAEIRERKLSEAEKSISKSEKAEKELEKTSGEKSK
jgi:type II secretion system protein D